ncbi:MAG: response regulator [Candidatus Zixiibacteriota bacterium]|nr:MAG: response regulator [candidate division Zixibacteria bacterium]
MARKLPDNVPRALGWPLDLGVVTVLMVEDNPDHADLAMRALEDYGFRKIDVASTMAEAFAMMRSHGYQVLLVDYCLPDGYGIDLLDWVDDRCTVVMMTAQGSEKVAAEAFKRGALDYVVKDSLFREILPEIVEQALAKNDSIRRATLDSCDDPDCGNKSAVAYRQDIPSIKGYVHVDYLKTTLGKMRRHLAEIRGCLRVIRYNPEEPITENQLGFVDSGLDNCELLEELLRNLVLDGERKSSDAS